MHFSSLRPIHPLRLILITVAVVDTRPAQNKSTSKNKRAQRALERSPESEDF